jgi:glycosyltransferase involved in cell wall biosynthesis
MPSPSTRPRSVLWLPAHPAEGAASMDRYWRALDCEYHRQAARTGLAVEEAISIHCPLGAPPQTSRRAGRLSRPWHKYAAYPWQAWCCSRAGMDVVHVLDHSYAHLLTRAPRRVFKIATVHDLAPLRDATDLTPAQRDRFRRTVECLKLANLLLADSQPSASDTVEMLGIAPEKIRVLPLGVDVPRFAQPPAGPPPRWLEPLASRKVILSVGSVAARKNLQSLPAILQEVHVFPFVGHLTLLRIGDPLPEALRNSLHNLLGPRGLLELGAVPEDELVAAYQRADALIFPSCLEGFGFPVLEAMAAGCPVVCSDATSLPEVGGDAALYFPPDNPIAAARHLRAVLDDPLERNARIAAGRLRADQFSWRQHYLTLTGIYRAAPPSAGD